MTFEKTENQTQGVPERKECTAGEMNGEWRTTTNGEVIELEIDTKSCKGTSQEINYIEHVQAYISEFILIE